MPIWPERYRTPPALIACEYGPMAAGASAEKMTSFMKAASGELLFPVECKHLLHVGMQTQMDGTGMGATLNRGLLPGAVFPIRHVKDDFDFSDAPGIGAHGLDNVNGCSGHVNVMRSAVNADDGSCSMRPARWRTNQWGKKLRPCRYCPPGHR